MVKNKVNVLRYTGNKSFITTDVLFLVCLLLFFVKISNHLQLSSEKKIVNIDQ